MIDNFDLYAGASANTSLQDLTNQMRGQISVKPTDANDARFVIRFEYGDPHVAQSVVADLLRRLIKENDHGEQLGIPGAYLKVISPPSVPSSGLFSMHWILLGEGLAGGLAVGALWSLRKRRTA